MESCRGEKGIFEGERKRKSSHFPTSESQVLSDTRNTKCATTSRKGLRGEKARTGAKGGGGGHRKFSVERVEGT